MKIRLTPIVAALFISLSVFFMVAAGVNAQTKPEVPKLTDAQKLTIRDAQVDLSSVQLEMSRLESQYRELEQKRNTKAQELSAKVATVIKAHNLKPEEWQLDPSLNLVKVEKK